MVIASKRIQRSWLFQRLIYKHNEYHARARFMAGPDATTGKETVVAKCLLSAKHAVTFNPQKM